MKDHNDFHFFIDRKATGRRIKELKKKSGFTVREICDHLGIANEACFYRWIKGESLPCLEHLLNLAFLFRVSIDQIIVGRFRSDDEEGLCAPLPCFIAVFS